jgi:hypothetical protein
MGDIALAITHSFRDVNRLEIPAELVWGKGYCLGLGRIVELCSPAVEMGATN